MNEEKPDFKALSQKHKINEDTLKTRWNKGLRGDALVKPVMSRQAISRKGRKTSPWNTLSIK